tara:strand:+ start:471 stop:890 length:420 start_codon:yes stop_codon:yes gene_type:complete
MKKIALLLTVVLSSTVFYSQETLELSKDFKRQFKKRNVNNVDQSLLCSNFIKTSNNSIPDFLKGIPSLEYDTWINTDFREKIHIFKSNNDKDLALFQLKYMYINIKREGTPFFCYQTKVYDLILQEQDDYLVAMFVIKV